MTSLGMGNLMILLKGGIMVHVHDAQGSLPTTTTPTPVPISILGPTRSVLHHYFVGSLQLECIQSMDELRDLPCLIVSSSMVIIGIGVPDIRCYVD